MNFLYSSVPRIVILGESAEQLRRADPQDFRDAAEIQDGEVALAALDGPDEGAV